MNSLSSNVCMLLTVVLAETDIVGWQNRGFRFMNWRLCGCRRKAFVIFTAVSILIAVGWFWLFVRTYRILGKGLFQSQHRAVLVALICGTLANLVELFWLGTEWYRPPIIFRESWKFIVYAAVGFVASVVTGFTLMFSPRGKQVPVPERRLMIIFSLIMGIESMLMLPLSVVFS